MCQRCKDTKELRSLADNFRALVLHYREEAAARGEIPELRAEIEKTYFEIRTTFALFRDKYGEDLGLAVTLAN